MTITGRPSDIEADLLDTSRCAVRLACECCEKRGDLAVVASHTPLGVLCVTLCRACGLAGRRPRWSGPRGADRIYQHCQHLGIDRARMSTLLAQHRHLGLPEVWLS
ncbi:hypothetical protein GCM10011581_30600 [Saccharopolyspora subtropica]|uniref:Uncharacterized protein n=1 Tax=Saccharopolyspora thermophila TaxID=89367 RepID=A0A917NDG8_9PSEU|nr:hypothetical protein [Saccharopolyspora subtropica]GGI91397.1 hypothetical protein GCM10011581_30600 [Saccharopolyspora subtropica]